MATNPIPQIIPIPFDFHNYTVEDATTMDINNIPEDLRLALYVLTVTLSVLGVIFNTINIIVFWKLQKQEAINVNLFGLAVSDWMVCLTSLTFTLTSGTWYLKDLFKAFRIVQIEVMYLTLGVIHSVSVRITVLLTTSISLQRCLCVILPLKVKGIFTRSRVIKSVVISFIAPTLMIMVPVYYVNRLQWVPIPEFNTTLLRLVVTDDFYEVNRWSTPINSTVLLIIPFITVLVCSVIMARGLRKRIIWRLTGADNSDASGRIHSTSMAKDELNLHKENRIIKMVLTLSIFFLVSYAPNAVVALFVAFTSSFNIRDINDDVTQLVGYAQIFLDTLNSSINLFIYLRNSTKYKTAFKALFCQKKR